MSIECPVNGVRPYANWCDPCDTYEPDINESGFLAASEDAEREAAE